MTTTVARILGMKESVCSWICVTAWKTLTIRPTERPTSSSGSATLRASSIADTARLMTTSVSISVEAPDERGQDEVPAVHQDEQEDLERERDEDRWQHHHPERHERRAHDEVDDEERQEDQEPDLEGRLELGDDEGRDEDVGRDVRAGLRPLDLRELHEQREVAVVRLLEHELADRLLRALDRLLLVDLLRLERLGGVVVDRLDRRHHHEDRQEQRDADEHLVRRRGRRAEARADEAQDDEDPREARDGEEQRRDERDAAQEQEDLDRVRPVEGRGGGGRDHERTVFCCRRPRRSRSAAPGVGGCVGSSASKTPSPSAPFSSPSARASSSR